MEALTGGKVLYSKTQPVQTDNLGLFTINLGNGNPLNGSIFSNIDWSKGTKWLKVEMDVSGQGNYIDMGTTQMLSVPYALYAGNVLNGTGSLNDAYNFGGAGNGSNINANAGPVLIVAPNTATASNPALSVIAAESGGIQV